MIRCLQRLAVVAFVAITAPGALAASCAPGTLSDYLALTSCKIDGATFSDFFLGTIPFGAAAIDPAAVAVTPSATPEGPGLLLTFDQSASGAEFFDLAFQFNVTGDPDVAFYGDSAILSAAAATLSGAVTLVEQVCVGNPFVVAPFGCPTAPSVIIPIVIDGFASTTESDAFGPAAMLGVSADFAVDAGGFGTATLGSGALLFLTRPVVSNVSEPATALLLVLAIVVLLAVPRAPARSGR